MNSQVVRLIAVEMMKAGLPATTTVGWVLADEATGEGYYTVRVASVAEVFRAEPVAERFGKRYGHEVQVAF